MEPVMCQNCLREVSAGSECEICGTSLTNERGLYEMPCLELDLFATERINSHAINEELTNNRA